MNISVSLTREPIPPAPAAPQRGPAAGAVVEFEGVVRGEEGGRAITALDYEAYDEMAVAEMERILRSLSAVHPCLSVAVIHRVGRIPVGEVAVRVRVTARHRAEAFGLLSDFMDRLKADVPVWKSLP